MVWLTKNTAGLTMLWPGLALYSVPPEVQDVGQYCLVHAWSTITKWWQYNVVTLSIITLPHLPIIVSCCGVTVVIFSFTGYYVCMNLQEKLLW